MSAIILGICLGIFGISFSWGINGQRMRNIIDTKTSHIQLHHPKFRDDLKIKYFLPDGQATLADIQTRSDVKAATGRYITPGILSDARNTFGVMIHGVDPESESRVTKLDSLLAVGEYFTGTRGKPILIGRKMAEKMKLDLPEFRPGMPLDSLAKLGRKPSASLRLLTPEEESISPKFKIVGIYDVQSSKEEEVNVYVRIQDLQELMNTPDQIHEIALLINGRNQLVGESKDLTRLKAELIEKYPEAVVEDWKDIAPDLQLIAESFGYITYIFMGIILTALLFGIINTMLMAVMERKQELGMLLSIGMSKIRVFLMIMWETIFLLLIAGPIGLFAGFLLVKIFGTVGIDLSAFSEGVESLGVSSMVYPNLSSSYYIQSFVMVVVASLVASLIPGLTAIGLQKASLRILLIAVAFFIPVIGTAFLGLAIWTTYPLFSNTVSKSNNLRNIGLMILSLIPLVSGAILIYYLIVKGEYELKPVNSIR
ncbi:MAG: FtsX-like permease family protein [Bacteroidota bacterium]